MEKVAEVMGKFVQIFPGGDDPLRYPSSPNQGRIFFTVEATKAN